MLVYKNSNNSQFEIDINDNKKELYENNLALNPDLDLNREEHVDVYEFQKFNIYFIEVYYKAKRSDT